jgi:CRISPR-associated protein Cas8c/Csp2
MKEFSHFYSKYGQALLYEESSDDYNLKAKELLELGLEKFRLKARHFEGEAQTSYNYARIKKGDTSNGVFLSPSVIISDLKATGLWVQIEGLIDKLETSKLEDATSIKQSFAPMTGEYNNGRSRHTPKSTLEEAVCCAITTLSIYKPSISFQGSDGKYTNYCIIPDLSVKDGQAFISLFKRMLNSDTSKSLFIGKVSKDKKKQGDRYIPRRPEIFYGNFPNPPRSSYLATIGIIASISEWAKEAKLTIWANEVLESLKNTTLYLVTYGDAKSFSYNHYVIDLAKEGQLRKIVDSLFRTELLEKSRWNYSSKENMIEYKKFDLFASRFLQLFNQPAFKDFLAFRAEYPNELKILFTTYFTKMEKISIEIVKSAKELGRWLNYVAYLTAKAEHKNTKSEEFKKMKAKVLVEIESSAFSAKTGDALIAQVVTRAGRLSKMDAPPEAEIYIEQTCSGELPLDNAKNLLMAFSRLRNKYEKPVQVEEVKTETNKVDTSEYNEQ